MNLWTPPYSREILLLELFKFRIPQLPFRMGKYFFPNVLNSEFRNPQSAFGTANFFMTLYSSSLVSGFSVERCYFSPRNLPIVNPVVALNLALRFIKPLAIKGRLLNQCHLLD
jgi:hypothetical protein